MNWTHAGTLFPLHFWRLVEFVEALTIILAVDTTRLWLSALSGAVPGVGVLALLVALSGPALQRIPLPTLPLVIGTLLLLFGIRYIRKVTLRSAAAA